MLGQKDHMKDSTFVREEVVVTCFVVTARYRQMSHQFFLVIEEGEKKKPLSHYYVVDDCISRTEPALNTAVSFIRYQ